MTEEQRQAAEAQVAQEHTFTVGNALYLLYRGGAQWRDMDKQLDLLTICVLVTDIGAVFVGKYAFDTAEEFDAALGAQLARDNALQQLIDAGN